ncbi:MAG: hypothetical protein ACMXX9_02220 [Candidatus Woesearchaeota archaeon]
MIVYLLVIVLAFIAGRLVAYFADDEIVDSKLYLRESLYVFQAYIIYYLSHELLFLIASYILFRLLKDNSFYAAPLLVILLAAHNFSAVLLGTFFSYILGLYEYKQSYWKKYALIFIIGLVIFYSLKLIF